MKLNKWNVISFIIKWRGLFVKSDWLSCVFIINA